MQYIKHQGWGFHVAEARITIPELRAAALKYRKERGWSSSQMAFTVGLDPSSYHRFEKGRRTLSLKGIVALCTYLGFKLSDPYQALVIESLEDKPQKVALTPAPIIVTCPKCLHRIKS